MDSSFLSFLLTFSHTFHSSSIQSVVFAIHLQIAVLLGGIQKQTKERKKKEKVSKDTHHCLCRRERERERERDGWLVGWWWLATAFALKIVPHLFPSPSFCSSSSSTSSSSSSSSFSPTQLLDLLDQQQLCGSSTSS
jgi:hypothetical protein